MDAFKAFATLSLIDLISGPLGDIRQNLDDAGQSTASLGDRFGRLALAMAPLAIGAGVLLGAFGACVSQAIAFESAMADVAKVVNFETKGELNAMSDAIKNLSGRIPMASEGLAAIVAAAGQSGVAKGDLLEFTEQAAKMGVAFDLTGAQAGKMMSDWMSGMALTLPRTYALADAVNHLSNNMNASAPALGEVIQRVGAVAMSCGLAETQVAALGAAFLSGGASPEVAATALKKFTSTLTKGVAMTNTQADAFRSLGFSAVDMAKTMQTDAQGTIFKVLEALADKPKELHVSLLTQMFGEEAIGAIAPLLTNMGNLSKAFELVGDTSNYAGSMQAEFETRSATAGNALQLMQNKFQNLAISIGTIFLPFVSAAAKMIGNMADALRSIVDSEFGQWLFIITGKIAVGVLAFTAFAAGMWAFAKIGSILASALLPIKAAIMGLSWPILLVIAAIALLYTAYTKNFGGMADTIGKWAKNIKLVFRGVSAVFENLTGTSFELRGELATDIKAAGLGKFVVNIAKIVHRLKALFSSIIASIDISGALAIIEPVGEKIGNILTKIGNLFSKVFGGEVTMATSTFTNCGEIIGNVINFSLEALATILNGIVNAISMVIDAITWLCAIFTGDFAGATAAANNIWDTFLDSLMSFANLFGIGDWIRTAWADATTYLSSINLYECGAKILETLKQGILSKATAIKDSVTGVFSNIRDLLPFSDAKEGPLSQLTLNGARIMTTLAQGVASGAGELQKTLTGALSDTLQDTSKLLNLNDISINSTAQKIMPQLSAPSLDFDFKDKFSMNKNESMDAESPKTQNTSIHIGQIVLPNVADGKGFLQSLDDAVTEFGGGFSAA